MKKTIITTIIIASFLFSGTYVFSQENVNFPDPTENTFTSNELTDFEISGFESHAIQKVKEYANYIEIISNKNFDNELREQAVLLVISIFNDEKTLIIDIDNEITTRTNVSVDEYFNLILKSNFSKISVKVSDFVISENLNSHKNHFKGKIVFIQSTKYYDKNILVSQKESKKEVEIFLLKVEKDFGNNKSTVWKIFLGEIISL